MAVFRVGKSAQPSTRPRQALQPARRSPFNPVPDGSKSGWLSRAGSLLLIILILAGLGWDLLVNLPPKLTADNPTYHSVKAYTDFAVVQANSLRDKTKLTFNQKALVAAIKSQFPEVVTASVQMPFIGQTPQIKLSIAAPAFFISDAGGSYILNSEGVVVVKSSQLPAIKNLLTISDQSGFKLQPGGAVLAPSAITFISTLVGQAEHAKVPISSLSLPNAGQELDVRTSDTPYFTKFYLGGDVLNQIGQFLAARHQFTATHTQPSQYLDVRVPGKIYYR